MFNNLRELILSMPTEQACREYLAQQRWVDGKAECPYCGHKKCYSIENGERYKCANNKCYKRFRITVGTIMEASNIPLVKWFTAIYLVTAHKKGISSYQLGRDLGIAQKNAWFMLCRIREMLRKKEDTILGKDKTVEADETYVGGSISNKHYSKRKEYAKNPQQLCNKTTVLGMIERGGELVVRVINTGKPYEIVSTVSNTVEKNADIMTDTATLYQSLKLSYNHQAVNHSANEYIRGNVHTNTIEGAFSHFKRMIYGVYHQISPKHTHRYCDEFAHRFNSRKLKDADRFTLALSGIEGRLKYKDLIAIPEGTIVPVAVEGKVDVGNGVKQISKDGEIIKHFVSSALASKETGIDQRSIARACRGERKSAGGFFWIYA